MKLTDESGDMDLTGKSFLLVVHEGETAEVVASGTRHAVGQLLDAAVTVLTGGAHEEDPKQVC